MKTSKVVPLGPTEQSELAQHERTISEGMQTFRDVAIALAAIRDGRLYRATFPTFEAYCQERWGWTRRHADQLIMAEATAAAIENHGSQAPKNARQLRPLAKLPLEDRAGVWNDVCATGEPTAKRVAAAVEHIQNAQAHTRPRFAKDIQVRCKRAMSELRAALRTRRLAQRYGEVLGYLGRELESGQVENGTVLRVTVAAKINKDLNISDLGLVEAAHAAADSLSQMLERLKLDGAALHLVPIREALNSVCESEPATAVA